MRSGSGSYLRHFRDGPGLPGVQRLLRHREARLRILDGGCDVPDPRAAADERGADPELPGDVHEGTQIKK